MAGQIELIKYGAIGLVGLLAYFKIVKPLMEPANIAGAAQGVGMAAVWSAKSVGDYTAAIFDIANRKDISLADLNRAREQGISLGKSQQTKAFIDTSTALLPLADKESPTFRRSALDVTRAGSTAYSKAVTGFVKQAPLMNFFPGVSPFLTNMFSSARGGIEQKIIQNTSPSTAIATQVAQVAAAVQPKEAPQKLTIVNSGSVGSGGGTRVVGDTGATRTTSTGVAQHFVGSYAAGGTWRNT